MLCVNYIHTAFTVTKQAAGVVVSSSRSKLNFNQTDYCRLPKEPNEALEN